MLDDRPSNESGVRVTDEQFLARVYDELRQIAAAKLAFLPVGQTLQPTALVHEAFLRINGQAAPATWKDESHFIAAAVQAMRHTLVDRARYKGTAKHGGNFRRSDLEDVSATEDQTDRLIALHEALTELESHDAQLAQLVNLRYFGGLSHSEAASVMQISRRTADRFWMLAKAWLYRRLEER